MVKQLHFFFYIFLYVVDGYHLYLLEKEGVFRNRISRQYKNAVVKDAGSFGARREWKLVDVKLTDLQIKELDLLYKDMMDFVERR